MKTRIIAFITCILMMLTVFAACANSGEAHSALKPGGHAGDSVDIKNEAANRPNESQQPEEHGDDDGDDQDDPCQTDEPGKDDQSENGGDNDPNSENDNESKIGDDNGGETDGKQFEDYIIISFAANSTETEGAISVQEFYLSKSSDDNWGKMHEISAEMLLDPAYRIENFKEDYLTEGSESGLFDIGIVANDKCFAIYKLTIKAGDEIHLAFLAEKANEDVIVLTVISGNTETVYHINSFDPNEE